jgi:tetratricopeptide (TPR) repeat protein
MATQALINKRLGTYYYPTDADKSIHHFRQAVSYYTLLGDKPNMAIGLQSLAFAYDEQKFNVADAIPYARQALDIWKELDDTLQAANMYKYVGLLQGKTSQGTLAKQNITKAIELYRAKHYENGVAVSWHNLAIVNQYQRRYDSAIAYIDMASRYWRGKDSARLFELNNLAIEIHLAVNNVSAAQAAYAENSAIFSDKYFWRDKLTFYSNGASVLSAAGDEKNAAIARKKYDTLYESLKKKGLISY